MPAEPPHERLVVPEPPRVMLVVERVHVRPVFGVVPVLSATVPLKPFTLVATTADVPVIPASTVTIEGLAITVKS